MTILQQVRDEAEKIKEAAETTATQSQHKIWSHLIAAASGAAIAVAILEALK